ncbi:hypothetical protein E3N88_07027 [Mikania micrantha]|uniref:Rotamase n=1 Tax=Mikania micrantha TaxID=192012 RepID=A0A5N6PR37_9ASTR|nr:hypothetical protein E3N88_07027 [Mikania micrantha]
MHQILTKNNHTCEEEKTMLSYVACTSSFHVPHIVSSNLPHSTITNGESNSLVTRRALSLIATGTASVFSVPVVVCNSSVRCLEASAATPPFSELPDSGGVKALDLRVGDGDSPVNGDQVSMLSLSQFLHPVWIETAVRSMKVGGIRRVIIPPSQGYQNMDQEPVPPNKDEKWDDHAKKAQMGYCGKVQKVVGHLLLWVGMYETHEEYG